MYTVQVAEDSPVDDQMKDIIDDIDFDDDFDVDDAQVSVGFYIYRRY